ncbi:hypothetical protein FRC02_000052 [Tulasnella sp. 418]|nr:hypothetical protein FRC02_000052 [Tulasnella sp. 418]
MMDFNVDSLPPDVLACLERLKSYSSSIPPYSIEGFPEQYANDPKPRLAAVLVLLYYRSNRLRVLLTTRSKSLRSHPGQVALPGGKSDPTDRTPVYTARREAFEEVQLPLDSPHIHILCQLHPFVSLWRLLVTPVVAYLSDISLLDNLIPNEDEVDNIFDHPLEMFLDPSMCEGENLSVRGSTNWPYPEEFHNTSDVEWIHQYRMHRFRSSSTPIKGLTSDILILTAEIAFDRVPVYERNAPNQATPEQTIAWVMDETKRGALVERADRKPEPLNSQLARLMARREEESLIGSGTVTPTSNIG